VSVPIKEHALGTAVSNYSRKRNKTIDKEDPNEI